MGRAERRAHIDRLRKKRSRHYTFYDWKEGAQDPKFFGRYVTTPKMCSCPMCCNARKTQGPTRQELVAVHDEMYG